ncbi:Coiled-coil domain-containing protein 97 [Cladochytrium tenue]|nr:Coiled-coil domain-containing protein 97 [Cladochytrium tenue]
MDPDDEVAIAAHVAGSSLFRHREPLGTARGLAATGAAGADHTALLALLRRDASGFLARYGWLLDPSHLRLFQLSSTNRDPDLAFAVASLRSRLLRRSGGAAGATARAAQSRARNRRFTFIQGLDGGDDGEGYFSDEAMRRRDPRLFEFYVGELFLPPSLVELKSYHSFKGRHISATERMKPFAASVGLVDRMFRDIDDCAYLNSLASERDPEQRDRGEEQVVEYDTDDDEDGADATHSRSEDSLADSPEEDGNVPRGFEQLEYVEATEEERQALRVELKRIMKERFISGLDANFDYSTIDDDPAYDDRRQQDLDIEDDYFDSEEPTEGTSRRGVHHYWSVAAPPGRRKDAAHAYFAHLDHRLPQQANPSDFFLILLTVHRRADLQVTARPPSSASATNEAR